jgi:PAS domain S-box-containing protein
VNRVRTLSRGRCVTSSPPDFDKEASTILESVADGFAAMDREWRYVHVNAAWEAFSGKRRQELLGQTIWEVSPELLGTVFERECR